MTDQADVKGIADLDNPEIVQEIEQWAIKRAFSKLRLGFALVNSDLQIVYANPLFVSMTTKDEARVKGQPLVEVIEELKSAEYLLAASAQKKKRRVVADLKVVRSEQSGKEAFFSLIVEALPEFGKSFLVILSEIQPEVIVDLHSREALQNLLSQQENLRRLNMQMYDVVHAREKSLEATQAFNAAVLESTAEGIMIINEAGIIKQANPSCDDLFGSNAGELIGKNLWGFLDKRHSDPEIVSGVIAGNYSMFKAPREVQFIRVEGERYYAEVSINVLLIQGQHLYVVILRDVTDRVKKERKIAQHREELQVLAGRLVDTQEKERKRLALDLHDDIGQRITGLSLAINSIFEERLGASLEDAAPEVCRQLEETSRAVRNLSRDLRPSILDHFGVAAALEDLGSRFAERSSLNVAFKFENVEAGDRFPAKIEISVYRIVQESLNNVAKYAGVDQAHVLVAHRGHLLVVSVRDEGKGFVYDPAEASKKSVGLLGMKERASQLGGEMYVMSKVGVGTTITAELPLLNQE